MVLLSQFVNCGNLKTEKLAGYLIVPQFTTEVSIKHIRRAQFFPFFHPRDKHTGISLKRTFLQIFMATEPH